MRLILVLLLVGANSGCSALRSRYAMEDPIYAEKYADGAAKTDLLGKAKQALDARHTGGLMGLYLSGGAQVRPDSGNTLGGGEIGVETYPANWLSARGALGTYLGADDGFAGLDLGLRLQTPTRIAPFVGIGAFNGLSRGIELTDQDGLDNDEDGFVDEYAEDSSTVDGWMSAIYPEVGAHFWLNGKWRLTAYGRYLVTTEGRGFDDWLLGGQLTAFTR